MFRGLKCELMPNQQRGFVMRYDGTGVEQLTDKQWEDGAPAWQLVIQR